MTGFTELASVDGGIGPTAEATIGLKDDGLYRGDGAFEVIRLYDGRPFALDDHIARLERSAASLRLEFDRMALRAEIAALLAEAGPIDGQLRLIVTRGGRRIAATENVPVHARDDHPRLGHLPDDDHPQRGQVALLRRPTCWRRGWRKSRAPTRRCWSAPTGSCWSRRPPRSSGSPTAPSAPPRSRRACSTRSPATACLKAVPGIEEGAWTLDQVKGASEAFLASTTREVQAVASIDGVALPAAPGPRTREAQEAFAAARDASSPPS